LKPTVVLEDKSLRDGLQFEAMVLSLDEKLSLFRLLVDAGVYDPIDSAGSEFWNQGARWYTVHFRLCL
jgi:hypothetical protein